MSSQWNKHLLERLLDWHDQGLARRLKRIDGRGVRVKLDGRELLSFASNDYLGLAIHPSVVQAAQAALERYGAGAGASPLITGHKEIHAELCRELAAFKQAEAALLFASGYQAAAATISAIALQGDAVILDRLSHASLLDGANLSGARVRSFKHNNVADLRAVLEREEERRCLVVVESLYSMDGDAAPLPELVALTEQAGALLLVDEAHATGVLGARGRGGLDAVTAARGQLPPHVIAMGTLSKALGSQGGFICATQTVSDVILHAGRAYMFSTALAPASVGAALAALKLIDAEPQRRAHLRQLCRQVRAGLANAGLASGDSDGPIVPVLAGAEERATEWSARLLAQGLLVPAVRYPTVKRGQARLRVSLSAGHTPADCEKLVSALAGLS